MTEEFLQRRIGKGRGLFAGEKN